MKIGMLIGTATIISVALSGAAGLFYASQLTSGPRDSAIAQSASNASDQATSSRELQSSNGSPVRKDTISSLDEKKGLMAATDQLIETVPVATEAGTVFMSPVEYEDYTKTLGHLPVLSPSYVFGRTISMPEADQNGHVRVLTSEELAHLNRNLQADTARRQNKERQDFGSEIPVATTNGIRLMGDKEYRDYARTLGHLPVLSKEYVFGHSVPMPKTDKEGHISVSDKSQPLIKSGPMDAPTTAPYSSGNRAQQQDRDPP